MQKYKKKKLKSKIIYKKYIVIESDNSKEN